MSTKLNTESIIDGSIEKIKLAESVQKSLNKADNAMQLTDVKTLELSDKNIKRLDVANGTTKNYLTALDEATSPLHSANRLQFINPNGMIVEYSTDGGATWVNYGISDADKILLTSGKGTILQAGKGLSETASSSDLLRITLNAADLQVYTSAKLLLINFSTNGSNNCILDIETAYRGTETNFSIWKQGLVMKGWSGWNRIPLNMLFGGDRSQTSQIGAIRLIFSSSGATSGTGQHFKVLDLQLFGSSYWTTPSTMARTGHLYDYNSSQTMILPQSLWPKTNGVGDIGASNYYWNNVYSNNFIKKNSSNDYVLLGGGSHKKLSDIKNEINHLVGKGAQNNALLRDLTSNPQDTTLYTGGWNTGSLTGKTYATDYGTTLDISYSSWYQRLGFNTSKGNSDKPRIEYFQGINTSDGSLTKIGDLAYLSDVTDYIVLDCLYVDDIDGASNSTLTLDVTKTKKLIDSILTGKKLYIKKNNTANYIYPISYTNPGFNTKYYGGRITFIAENVEYRLNCLNHPKPDTDGDKNIISISKTVMLTDTDNSVKLNNLSEEVQTSLGKADNSVRLTTGGGDINPGYNGDKQFYIQKVDGVPTLKIEMLTKSDVLSGKYTGNNGNSPFVGADIVWDLYNDAYDLADSKYTKPEEGISITDLEEYVQEAVSKAHVSVAKSDLYYEVISFTIDDINNCIKNGDTEFTIDNEPNNNNFRNGKPLMIKKNADSEALYPLTYTKQGNTISMNYSGTISCVVEGVTYEFDISYVAINSAATISNIKRYYNDYHVLSFTLEDLDNISTSPIEINVTELFRVIRSNQPIIIKNSIDDSDRGGFLVSGLSELADDGETLYINLNIFALTNLWKINNLALDNTDRSEQTYTLTRSNITKYSLPNLSSGSADLLAKNNLKTINGVSIYKDYNVSGNIYTYYPISPVAVVGTADRAASYMLTPNILYNWGDYIPINISIVLGRPYENVVNEYVLQFKTTDTVPTVVFPSSVKWVSGNAPVLEENKIYQISIINNLGTVLSWDNA